MQAPGGALTIAHAGSRLHAWRYGSPDAPLVLLIHGGWMDHRMFDEQVVPLVEAGHQVLVPDLRGHGQSTTEDRWTASVRDMARDQLALLDAIEHFRSVWLVGQSLGGMIAQHVVMLAPHRVKGLVTVGAPCVTLDDRRIGLTMAAVWKVSGLLTTLLPEATFRRQLPAGTAVRSEAQDYVRQATEHVTKRDFRWLTRASRQASRRMPGYRIEAPVLITRGAHDTSRAGKLTAMTAPAWASRDPRARYVIIDGAGHQAHQDRPEAFNRLLIDFMGKQA